ncbi:MAG: hypothetical protein PHV28_10595 [Kiritimatiellae bacterium]|nr:hypothetical protein [Kiritimatiellia bacterium]
MSGPFDKARYEALLEGLEISEIRLSTIQAANPTGRIDSEYFRKECLKNIANIESYLKGWAELGSAIVELSGGATPLGANYPDAGVRFLRVQNIMQNFIDDSDLVFISQKDDEALRRSRLKENDVLLTITGVSYGKSAVVFANFAGSNINQHSVRMKIRPTMFEPLFVSTFLNSRAGKLQSDQNITGVTRPALDYSTIRRFRVPLASRAFQKVISATVRKGQCQFAEATRQIQKAEAILAEALGLGDWQPPEPLTYTCGSKEVLEAGRFDSQYFAPRVAQLLARLGKDGLTVRDVAPPRIEKFSPASEGTFRYIEISDLQSNGTAACETIDMRDAPSRATWTVRSGDVLTSTVRPNRRLSALVTPEQDGCVASSGFVVLQPQRVAAEVLLTYLRLPVFCELMDLHTSASLYPAISDRDLLALPFPKITPRVSEEIVATVRSAHAVRRLAQVLLARAQRAVETAIEEGEAAGMRELNPPATRKR